MRWYGEYCEIAGWGMQAYNNTDSYPDSIRAAQIKLGLVESTYCNYLYGRNVTATGKFCAGGNVDACQVMELLYLARYIYHPQILQEDSGGPLMCQFQGKYSIVGIVSSGKG